MDISTIENAEGLKPLVIITPFERKNDEKEKPYSNSGQEALDYIAIKKSSAERNTPLAEVFDEVAKEERTKTNRTNWYSALTLASWYIDRDLNELGTAGAKDLHDGILQAHLRYITKNVPSDKEIELMTSNLLPGNSK
jgi:hypothetical protein